MLAVASPASADPGGEERVREDDHPVPARRPLICSLETRYGRGGRGSPMSRTSREATLSELEDQLVKGGAAVIATDLDGVITHWSATAERLYGWSGAEAIGLPIFEFMITLDDRQLAEVRCKDGSLMVAHVRDALMKDDAGRPVGILGLSMDASSEPESPA
jgi:PAS domain-containing protein